jgi:hypothetical protein
VKNFREFFPPLAEGEEGYVPPDTDEDCPSEVDVPGGILPGGIFYCTRHIGHVGAHAAHGFRGDLFATWEDE